MNTEIYDQVCEDLAYIPHLERRLAKRPRRRPRDRKGRYTKTRVTTTEAPLLSGAADAPVDEAPVDEADTQTPAAKDRTFLPGSDAAGTPGGGADDAGGQEPAPPRNRADLGGEDDVRGGSPSPRDSAEPDPAIEPDTESAAEPDADAKRAAS